MESGFKILKARSLSDSIDIESLEKHYDFHLPPIYKVFAETFYLGEEHVIRDQYFEPSYEDYFDCKAYNYYFDGENIGFSHFIDARKAFEVYKSGGLSDFHYKFKYFPIASSDGNGLFVGTSGESIDKVLWDRADAKEPRVISNHVFEFVRGIKVEEVKEEFLYGNIKHSQLYKNWEEDFWRVR